MTAIEEDIFARPPRSARKPMQQLSHITCRVCGLPAQVKPDHPALLCGLCLEDLVKTQAGVAGRLTAALARAEQIKERWVSYRDISPAREHWNKVETAIVGVAEKRIDKAAFDAQWTKRKAQGGYLTELMLAYEDYCRETDAIAEELKRLQVAQNEINAAWLNKEGDL